MNWKKKAHKAHAAASKRSDAPARTTDDPRRLPADRFRTNVFTWSGPGVENIFIHFEPEMSRRNLWKDGAADGQSKVSAQSAGDA